MTETESRLMHYQALMKNALDAINIVDVLGNVVEANDSFCNLMGYTHEEALQLNLADWNAQWSKDELRDRLNHLANKSARFETVHRRKDGTLLNVEVSTAGVEIEGKALFFTSTRDITERKAIEKNLKAREERFQTLFDRASEGIVIISTSGKLVATNESFARMHGYTPQELQGINLKELDTPESSRQAPERIKRILAGESITFEVENYHKDGHIFPLEVSSSLIDFAGEPLIQGFVRDITERKLLEQRLRVSAVAFETHEAIAIADANANIIKVNQAFQDITGYSSEEVLGKNPRILSSGRHDRAFFADMWSQLLGNGLWKGEIWDKRKNGQIYPKWLTITAVKDGTGKTTEYVSVFSDITERKNAEEQIHTLAFYDALTKLPNRRLLMDRLNSALLISARSNRYGAVLFIDMDKFKILNDTLGHDVGDQLLIEVAERLHDAVREIDTVARLGGDEFVVLLEEMDLDAEVASRKVSHIAEKIRVSLSQSYQLNGTEQHSSPSIGVCLYRGNDEPIDTLLQRADMAMYQVKDEGRNGVRFFDPAMQDAVEARAILEADLRHAIPENQLRLFYQIQLDYDLQPLGAEALIRWNHPKRGMISPAQFIPIAEDSSLILDIGGWVLEEACRQLGIWSKSEQTRELTLAINVSAKQFKQHDFVENVLATIRFHQVKPSLLKLELTESIVLNDVADVIAKMHTLKAIGVRLSLDDFGTGFSSLSYLKQLPLDQIKIDQSFVRDIATDPNDAVMVKSIIDLAKNFRLNVIAEGVETDIQLQFLKESGCMAYQGYLFSKPVPIDEFDALI